VATLHEENMEPKEFQRHVLPLATLPQTGAPVISCYLNLEQARSSYHQALDERVRVLRRTLDGEPRCQFERALGQIEEYLRHDIVADTAGLAVFARSGDHPFFLMIGAPALRSARFFLRSSGGLYSRVENRRSDCSLPVDN
jgi:hypothetical protein